MSRLVETVKIKDGKILNASYHNERIERSLFGVFGITSDYDVEKIIEFPDNVLNGVFKCRIIYDNVNFAVEFSPYTIRHISSLKIVIDNTIDYKFKFEDRIRINELFQKRGSCDDILIIKNGMVTDTSFSNVIFKRSDSMWITPDTCLLRGTKREVLLRKGTITEEPIYGSDIRNYSEVRLINAMIDIDDNVSINTDQIKF